MADYFIPFTMDIKFRENFGHILGGRSKRPLGREGGNSQDLCLHTTTQLSRTRTNICALSEIRTHDNTHIQRSAITQLNHQPKGAYCNSIGSNVNFLQIKLYS